MFEERFSLVFWVWWQHFPLSRLICILEDSCLVLPVGRPLPLRPSPRDIPSTPLETCSRRRQSKNKDSLDSTGVNSSSDEEEERKYVPKRRWEMDEDTLKAMVNAEVENNFMGDDSDGESWSMSAAADREFQRRGENVYRG